MYIYIYTYIYICTYIYIYTYIYMYIYVYMFYSRFILLLSLSYTDHLVSIVPFIYDYLNFTTILLCLCFYSLFYHFVNLTFICNNNNLYIRLSFHFTYDTDEEIRDFEIYLSVILNDVILMLLFPHIFKWFFDIYIYMCYILQYIIYYIVLYYIIFNI